MPPPQNLGWHQGWPPAPDRMAISLPQLHSMADRCAAAASIQFQAKFCPAMKIKYFDKHLVMLSMTALFCESRANCLNRAKTASYILIVQPPTFKLAPPYFGVLETPCNRHWHLYQFSHFCRHVHESHDKRHLSCTV